MDQNPFSKSLFSFHIYLKRKELQKKKKEEERRCNPLQRQSSQSLSHNSGILSKGTFQLRIQWTNKYAIHSLPAVYLVRISKLLSSLFLFMRPHTLNFPLFPGFSFCCCLESPCPLTDLANSYSQIKSQSECHLLLVSLTFLIPFPPTVILELVTSDLLFPKYLYMSLLQHPSQRIICVHVHMPPTSRRSFLKTGFVSHFSGIQRLAHYMAQSDEQN